MNKTYRYVIAFLICLGAYCVQTLNGQLSFAIDAPLDIIFAGSLTYLFVSIFLLKDELTIQKLITKNHKGTFVGGKNNTIK